MVETKSKTISMGQALGVSVLSVTLFVGLMSLYDTRIIPLVMNQANERFASKEAMSTLMDRLDTLATKESIAGVTHRLDQIEARLMHLERAK